MTQKTIIEVQNLCKRLPIAGQYLDILKDITFEVYDHETLAIIGPSGSGKSTLMGLIGGLDEPTSGSIVIDGVDITHLSERRLTTLRNQKIGFVFQTFNLIPNLTALENVMLPMQFSSKRSGAKKRATELLNLLNLRDRLDYTAKRLSGGEQQRVAIARALVNEPTLLLCDEPTGNLDTVSTALVIDTLFAVRQQLGTTVVIVTHNPDLAQRLDRRVELVDGEITQILQREPVL